MKSCCNECNIRSVGCHAKCNKYKLYKIWYNMRKKQTTEISSQGRFLYNSNREHQLRHKKKKMQIVN